MTSVPTTKPPLGFMPWVDPFMLSSVQPRQFEVVEVWKAGCTETRLINPDKMSPEANVYGLFWRPVKRFGETSN